MMANGRIATCDAAEARRASALVATILVAAAGMLATRAAVAAGAAVTVTVTQGGDKPLAGTVLMLHPLGAPQHPQAPVRATMDQVNRMFVPDVLVIPVGSTVSFPNTDKVRHQVYSFSPAHRFQLPLYSGKPYPPQHFDRAGLVTLGCNIHDWMLAYIVVTDAEFFGSTDGSGKWSIKDVPSGRYRMEWWHPRLREFPASDSREIEVSGTEPVEVRVAIDGGLRPPAMGMHPHSWDAY